eukprot:c20791_g4_i1.p1 GENE.c20791_g4_i1~~c20791_g4_i1.p1  ORF type:complete len:113 (+),score=24.06 c20791_g4_i1:34-339(+)
MLTPEDHQARRYKHVLMCVICTIAFFVGATISHQAVTIKQLDEDDTSKTAASQPQYQHLPDQLNSQKQQMLSRRKHQKHTPLSRRCSAWSYAPDDKEKFNQ